MWLPLPSSSSGEFDVGLGDVRRRHRDTNFKGSGERTAGLEGLIQLIHSWKLG